jgi:hypothetical protein
VCDIVRKALRKKYVKDDVSVRDSFKENVSQRRLGSHRPHGTRAGLTVLKSGSLNLLEPSGPVQDWNGIAFPLPLLTSLSHLIRQ